MSDQAVDLRAALAKAGRRVVYHLLRAAIEGVKAIEAVIDEVGRVGEAPTASDTGREKVEIE